MQIDYDRLDRRDPQNAVALNWIPTIERSFLSLEERAKRLNFNSVLDMKAYADSKGIVLYTKPRIEKQKKMTFPIDIIEGKGGKVCKQCSSCHSCR